MLRFSVVHQAAKRTHFVRPTFIMGKRKTKGEYNNFTEDTRYTNNTNDVRTTLQSSSTLSRNISPPASTNRTITHNKPKAKKPPLTHFLCLPLVTSTNHPRLSQALSEFRSDVEKVTPVPAQAVRPVSTLHLTLGVMSLSSSQLSDAAKHLQDLDIGRILRGITTQMIAEVGIDTPTVSEGFGSVENPPTLTGLENPALQADPDVLSIELKGVLPMQRARQTSVLYAEPVDKTGRLLRFGESLRGSFEERGWVVRDERPLRLHATVLNTIYAKSKGGGRSKAGAPRTAGTGATSTETTERDGEAGGFEEQDRHGTDGEDGKLEHGKGLASESKSWMRFDASNLIEAYKDFVWAEDVRIDRVQICKMGAQKIVDEGTGAIIDEQYEVIAEKTM
jgi:activating signal cointegrator complex subunit 1